jgi:hypothetical protein
MRQEDQRPMEPANPQQPQIRMDVSRMDTVYANFFALAGSPDEIVLYVGTNSPLPNVNQQMIPISHRLMLLPPNAKRLMIALQQAIKAHEDRYGPIELPPPRHPPDAAR